MKVMRIGKYEVAIEGNRIIVTDENGPVTEQEIHDTYNPHYRTLEGFIEFCGDGFAAAVVEFPQHEFDVIYIFDHREEGPLPADLWTPEEWKAYREDGEKPDGIGNNFCYAINTLDGMMSEWGYAPFPLKGQTDQEYYERWAEGLRAFADAVGGEEGMPVVDTLNPDVHDLKTLLEKHRPE